MNLTLTIAVTEDENVSVQTRARDVSEAQIRPLLERASRALRAEIDALEACPFHARAHSSPRQVPQPSREDL